MKKYVKSNSDLDYDIIKLKLENNLYDLLMSSFEDNVAKLLSGKDGYDADWTPDAYYADHPAEIAADEARAEYISKLADLLLVNYNKGE